MYWLIGELLDREAIFVISVRVEANVLPKCVCVCVWNISADVEAHSKYACRFVVVYFQTLHVKETV